MNPRSVTYQPLPLDTQPWHERAKCQDADPEQWYPDKGKPATKAKQVCAGCPVTAECLEYALANGERWGVWGGLSERERRRLPGYRRRTVAANQVPGEGVAWRAGLTHCKHGHPFEGANLRVDPQTGARICRTCAARRSKDLKAKERRRVS